MAVDPLVHLNTYKKQQLNELFALNRRGDEGLSVEERGSTLELYL